MLGVVVSCDSKDGDALIWCEDHAELAYFKAQAAPRPVALRPKVGDLVQFKLAEKSGLRYAQALRVLAPSAMPDLANSLAACRPVRRPPLRRVV